MLRFFSILIGYMGTLWFLLPIISGVFNIGSVIGLAIFSPLLLCGIFKKRFFKLFAAIKAMKHGKTLIISFVAATLAVLSVFCVETVLIINAAINKSDNENAVVVVLGCRVRGEEPSKMLMERIDSAYEYLTEHENAICVLSGGQGEDEYISEAECMRRHLTEKGISEDRLIIEDRSTSTKENLAFTKELLRKRGHGNEIVIVTNEFHQYRAGLIAKEEGFTYSAKSVKTELPLLPTYIAREYLAIAAQWLKLK